jgi:hypothetical protein
MSTAGGSSGVTEQNYKSQTRCLWSDERVVKCNCEESQTSTDEGDEMPAKLVDLRTGWSPTEPFDTLPVSSHVLVVLALDRFRIHGGVELRSRTLERFPEIKQWKTLEPVLRMVYWHERMAVDRHKYWCENHQKPDSVRSCQKVPVKKELN